MTHEEKLAVELRNEAEQVNLAELHSIIECGLCGEMLAVQDQYPSLHGSLCLDCAKDIGHSEA